MTEFPSLKVTTLLHLPPMMGLDEGMKLGMEEDEDTDDEDEEGIRNIGDGSTLL